MSGQHKMNTFKIFLFSMLFLTFTSLSTPSYAQRYSASEVAAAIQNSSLNSDMKQYSSQIGNLAIFESGGRTTIYNGSCCTGILQMNNTNIRNYTGLTRQQYAQLPLQDQVNAWARLTNDASRAGSVQTLINMQKNGESFDGRKVDGNLVLACIQLGTGNCQKMVRSGSCSGFKDSNGTTICKMADKMGDPNTTSDPYGNNSGDQSEKENDNSSNNGSGKKPDMKPQECWACDAVSFTLQLTSPMLETATGIVDSQLLSIITIAFAIFILIKIISGLLFIPNIDYRTIWISAFRFTIVMTVLSQGAFFEQIFTPYVIQPTLQAGGYIGTEMANKSMTALSLQKPSGTCIYRNIPNADTLASSGKPVIDVVCAVSLAFNSAIEKISVPANRIRTEDSSLKNLFISAILSICALISMASLWYGLLIFAGQVLDAVVRIIVFSLAMPWAIIIWIFQIRTSARPLIQTILQGFLYNTILLSVCGLLSGVMLLIVNAGLHAATSTSIVSIDNASMLMETILLFFFSIVTGTMAAKIMQSAPSIASIFATGSILSMAQDISGSIAAGISKGVSSAMMIVGFSSGTLAAGTGLGLRTLKDLRHFRK